LNHAALVVYGFLGASFCASEQAVPGFLSNNFNKDSAKKLTVLWRY
jgi:hypothetical protein